MDISASSYNFIFHIIENTYILSIDIVICDTFKTQIMSTKSVSKAFQKMHVEKKSKTLSDTLREWFDIIFRWAIPEAVQDMPPRGMYFVGISSIVTATLLFLIIVWATYGSNINTIYLSPNENSGICESVARPISGVYLADVNGSWNSNIYYDSSLAIYQFRFQELRANASFWKEMIGNLSISIDLVAAKMKIQPLDINLLWWLVWEGNFAVQGTTQYFGFYSDPTVVFNRQYVHGVISNVVSDCNATSSSKYDVGSYYLSLTYSFSEFMSNPRCTSVMNPYTMGYDPVYDGDEFTLSYDVRSLVTALAINGKILGFGAMRPLVGSIFSFIYNNVSYLSGQFQNSRFPGKYKQYEYIYVSIIVPFCDYDHVLCFIFQSIRVDFVGMDPVSMEQEWQY